MHHFSKFHKKLWYHLALSLGSALVTVALFDTLCSLSWLCKDYEIVAHYSGEEDSSTPINFLDIAYCIFVAYRMILSLVICVGGIFMGRRVVVIVWLVVSLFIDLIHLGETIFILSKPNLMTTWPIIVAVSSCIWQELKIVRIKYRIIRRSLLVDTNNNGDYEIEPDTLQKEIQSHCDSNGRYHFEVVDTTDDQSKTEVNGNSVSALGCYEMKTFWVWNKTEKYKEKKGLSHYVATNAIHFIKLVRNLYNLLTWHITGYLFGGDYHQFISTNYKAMFLEQRFIRYARVFLDALTVIYIVQEKRMLLTPWIMAYIMIVSASIAVFLFTLLHLNLLTTLFASIYYLVFFTDLFFRCSFLIFCIKYVVETRNGRLTHLYLMIFGLGGIYRSNQCPVTIM